MKELKEFREALKLSTQEMAYELKLSKSLYEKIEVGQRNASNNFLKRLKARFPQFDVNIFFTSNHTNSSIQNF